MKNVPQDNKKTSETKLCGRNLIKRIITRAVLLSKILRAILKMDEKALTQIEQAKRKLKTMQQRGDTPSVKKEA